MGLVEGETFTDDLDLWWAAQLFVMHHGEKAAIQASFRADELLAEGDIDGQRAWLRIAKAVEASQRPKPAAGEEVN
jgi:hypothetical protein